MLVEVYRSAIRMKCSYRTRNGVRSLSRHLVPGWYEPSRWDEEKVRSNNPVGCLPKQFPQWFKGKSPQQNRKIHFAAEIFPMDEKPTARATSMRSCES